VNRLAVLLCIFILLGNELFILLDRPVTEIVPGGLLGNGETIGKLVLLACRFDADKSMVNGG
jgi:hypothetical protein